MLIKLHNCDRHFSPDTLLHYTKWFFSLPSEVRMSLALKAWNPKSSNHYRGYFPVTAGMTCHKEGMSIAQDLPPDDADILSENIMYEPNAWPPETLPGAVDFKKFMQSYHNSMMKVTLQISHLIAIGLGKEENYLINSLLRSLCLHSDSCTTLPERDRFPR